MLKTIQQYYTHFENLPINTKMCTKHLPVLFLQLGKQLHLIRTEPRWRGWREARRGKRCGRGGGSGLQGCGRGHLASHLTDCVGHRVLHPWESRTQLSCNLVRHLKKKKGRSFIPASQFLLEQRSSQHQLHHFRSVLANQVPLNGLKTGLHTDKPQWECI